MHQRATCLNCPAPLRKRFGRWSHHRLHRHLCDQPQVKPGTEQTVSLHRRTRSL